MENQIGKEYALETIVLNAVKIPGVKVSRHGFLENTFAKMPYDTERIIAEGPVNAGVTREELKKLAAKLIFTRTSESSIASFLAGIPGGIAMAATIPADILQFFGISLRLAQEISYLYGAEDLWKDGQVDEERVRNQLLLYCGVMFGVSGAVSGLRVLTAQIAKTIAKKLPQKALTKTFWYPIVKSIGKALSIKVTKATVANGLSKAVPVIGGIVSGSLNFISMMPMANRLQNTFDKACFDYTAEEYNADLDVIESNNEEKPEEKQGLREKFVQGFKSAKTGVTKWVDKAKNELEARIKPKDVVSQEDIFDTIAKLKELYDAEILTKEEFETKKAELLARI
jgi:hypothetical protein